MNILIVIIVGLIIMFAGKQWSDFEFIKDKYAFGVIFGLMIASLTSYFLK